MKINQKRPRSDSTTAAITAIQSAAKAPLKPPAFVNVRKRDVSRWNAIVLARPRDTWNQADLILAGHLTRAYADMEQLEQFIDDRGMIGPEGEINPACAMLDKATRRALALARQLKVDAISTVGKSRDVRKSSELESDARSQMAEDDGLIPRATH
jgi:phage terminase small subunit